GQFDFWIQIWGVKVLCDFWDLQVNTDNQILDMDFESVQTLGLVADVDKIKETVSEVTDAASELAEIVTGGNENTRDGSLDTDINYDGTIPDNADFVLDSESGTLTINDSDGNVIGEISVPKDEDGNPQLPCTVQDSNGNAYQLDKSETGGNNLTPTSIGKQEAPLTSSGFNPTQLSEKAAVTFEKGNGKQAFDQWQSAYGKNSDLKKRFDYLTDSYYAAWKFLAVGSSDKISATIDIKDNSISPEKVIFQTPQGRRFEAKRNENKYELTLASGQENDVQEIYALYPIENGKYLTFGKLNVVSYNSQHIPIIVVQVNTQVEKSAIESRLQEIYAPVGITFDVKLEQFSYSDTENFFEKTSGVWHTYNEKMRKLTDAYQAANPNLSNKTAIIFLLNESGERRPEAGGFMPKGKQWGFVFRNGQNDTQIATSIAHELGHGRWRFSHTFDYSGLDSNDLTDNLMNYSGGTQLTKLQWELISYPAWVSNPFEGDEKGMITSKSFYWTPSGHIIYIDNPQTGITDFSVPNGTLYGFYSNDVKYTADIKDNKFYGYKTEEGVSYNDGTTEKFVANTDKVSVISRIYDGCTLTEYMNQAPPSEAFPLPDASQGLPLAGNPYFLMKGVKIKDYDLCSNSLTSPYFEITRLELPLGLHKNYLDDKEIKDANIQNSVSQLNTLIKKDKSAYPYSTEMVRDDLRMISIGENVSAESENLYRLDHRLVYLADYSAQKRDPINIYVVYTSVDFVLGGNWNEYAKKVYEASNLKNENAILITVPVYSADNTVDATHYSVRHYMPGIYSKGITINTQDIGRIKATTERMDPSAVKKYETITAPQVEEFISRIYIHTHKPYVIYLGLRYADGTIEPKTVASDKNTPGYNFVKTVLLKSNRYVNEMSKLQDPGLLPEGYPVGWIDQSLETDRESRLLEYELERAEILERSTQGGESDWEIVPNSIEFKEKMLDELTANKYITGYAFKEGFEQWKKDLAVVYGGTDKEPPVYDFPQTYNKAHWSTLDPAIYGVIDITSIIASFASVDAIPEAIGLMYATSRSDALSATLYSSAIVLPVVAGGELRIGQGVAAKLTNDSKIFFRGLVYSLNTEGKLTKLSTSYTRGRVLEFFNLSDNAVSPAEVDNFVKAFRDKKISNSQLKEILNEADEAARAAKLRNTGKLIENLDEAQTLLRAKYGQQLIDDFANNSEMLLRLANEEKLAEAWNTLYKAERSILRKNPEALEAFAKVAKNAKLKQLGFTDELLAKVHASTLDAGDFKTILNDLDNFGHKLAQNPT
ncbi:MAG: hypothetical protein LBD45_09435, partial [Bacteroidales bacterium]|nr:hypothetical protein [Bacteroidales bacterium]